MEARTRFPRWRALRRFVFATEQTLGRLPMVLLTPVVGAIIGTAWAVSHPVEELVRHGVVVSHSTFLHVLLLAVLGGLGGIVVIAGLVVLGAIGYYRLLGDRIWKARIYGPEEVSPGRFELACGGDIRVLTATLGEVECVVQTPSGSVWATRDMWSKTTPRVALYATEFDGLLTETGEYEARWYAGKDRGRLHEVARTRRRINVT